MSFSETPLTILLADDNPDVRVALEYMLRAQGYKVVSVGDGDAAVAALEENHVDLVLLDVLMPGRNGFSVCRHIKSQAETRLIPVVSDYRPGKSGKPRGRNRKRRGRFHQQAAES